MKLDESVNNVVLKLPELLAPDFLGNGNGITALFITIVAFFIEKDIV